MPIHDWTRVSAGTFHAFHLSWLSELQIALNDGLLPPHFYAQAEQDAGAYNPDVLTLHTGGTPPSGGGTATLARPRPRLQFVAEAQRYAAKRRRLTVRHTSGDRVVAIVEVVSPGNKGAKYPFDTFVKKAVDCIGRGCHLLVIDLFPPTARDPHGIHAAIWEEFDGTPFVPPDGEPLTLVSYEATTPARAFVEPTAVGRPLIDMPMYLGEDWSVDVPLETTYTAALRAVPKHLLAVLTG